MYYIIYVTKIFFQFLKVKITYKLKIYGLYANVLKNL